MKVLAINKEYVIIMLCKQSETDDTIRFYCNILLI